MFSAFSSNSSLLVATKELQFNLTAVAASSGGALSVGVRSLDLQWALTALEFPVRSVPGGGIVATVLPRRVLTDNSLGVHVGERFSVLFSTTKTPESARILISVTTFDSSLQLTATTLEISPGQRNTTLEVLVARALPENPVQLSFSASSADAAFAMTEVMPASLQVVAAPRGEIAVTGLSQDGVLRVPRGSVGAEFQLAFSLETTSQQQEQQQQQLSGFVGTLAVDVPEGFLATPDLVVLELSDHELAQGESLVIVRQVRVTSLVTSIRDNDGTPTVTLSKLSSAVPTQRTFLAQNTLNFRNGLGMMWKLTALRFR
jgi:hypothetical protein